MEKENDYVQKIHELEQELKIRIEDNAELYTKLCNVLNQLNEANKLLKTAGYGSKENTFPLPYVCPEECRNYLEKWGVK